MGKIRPNDFIKRIPAWEGSDLDNYSSPQMADAFANLSDVAVEAIGVIIDLGIMFTCEAGKRHPKWLHYFLHAKSGRVRYKYYKKLLRDAVVHYSEEIK